MGCLFSSCYSNRKCKYCGINEKYFASEIHRSRPSCRDSPDKMLLDDDDIDTQFNNNWSSYPGRTRNRRYSSNGYHNFV